MVTADTCRRYRWSSFGCATAVALSVAVATAGLAGCGHPLETGFSNQCKMQLQFYSPPGATVTIKTCPPRSHQIARYGPFANRLEQSPEEFSVFNLCPGKYEFKYTSADGLPGVSIYGEMEVQYANSAEARIFQRRSFVPICLPSEFYTRLTNATGDEIFPFRGEAQRTAIDQHDLERLRQGDLIEKVFVIADLHQAEKVLRQTQKDLAVCEREMEYAEARFKEAFYNFRLDVGDPTANFWGTDREFISREAKRQEIQQRWDKLNNRLKRTKALLNGDHVLIRKGMLVVATEQVVAPHKDVVDAAERIGEVLLVMRMGGRHMHWGDPRREMAAYQQ